MSTFLGQSAVRMGVATFSNVLPLIETEDCGGPYLVFDNHGNLVFPATLTGVVYRDANANDQYDPGGGVAGATVIVDGGSYYAVTTAGGGYALSLVRADGSRRITTL